MKEKRTGGPFTARVYREGERAMEAIKERACSPEEQLRWWLHACETELARLDASEPIRHPSPAWYLRQIADYAKTALGAAAAGNWWGAISMGMRFARLVKEFEVRDYQLTHARAGGHAKAMSERKTNSERLTRNAELKREYETRRAKSSAAVSDTKLKKDVGRKFGLGRSQTLKILSGVQSKVDR